MEYGICNLSIVPIRKEASDKSEMVSQLLFGETFHVISKQSPWVSIECTHDKYRGWIDEKQYLSLNTKQFKEIEASLKGFAVDLVKSITTDHQHIPIVLGSTLPFFDGINFKLLGNKYHYNGQAVRSKVNKLTIEHILKIARKYLNTPYLWGGRSPFGIDCSGYTQVVFKICGTPLPRDAYQQAEVGKTIDMIDFASTGDLAYFIKKGQDIITHVGIVVKNESDYSILHASGKVRLDKLDHVGIYNQEKKVYTHNLKSIKRVL